MQMMDIGWSRVWPAGDKQPIGSQQRFAKRQSLFTSFAWVDLGPACRSVLQAGRREWREMHKHLKCIPQNPSLQSHPCPRGDIQPRLISISAGRLCSALPRLPDKNCGNPRWRLIKLWWKGRVNCCTYSDVFCDCSARGKQIRYYLRCLLPAKILCWPEFVFITWLPRMHMKQIQQRK